MEKKINEILHEVVPEMPVRIIIPDTGKPKKTSAVSKRLIENAIDVVTDPSRIDDAVFQHSIFCQTYLPYKDPGDDVQLWEQKQGNASLAIQTIKIKNPHTGEWLHTGLPYGTRARLILAHINTQAVKAQSQVIDVEDNLTAFVKKLGLYNTGRSIGEIKEQIRRITASIITLGFDTKGGGYVPIQFGIVKSFDLFFPKNENQRVAWTSKICLSDDYFNSLMRHAIPLDESTMAALSHSPMAMDVYSWLAQRLHRIPHNDKHFITWQQLKEQFGQGYGRMNNFKSAFRDILKVILTQYYEARYSIEEVPNKGFNLKFAAPPIEKKVFAIPQIRGVIEEMNKEV